MVLKECAVLLATHNRGKVGELAALLEDVEVSVIGLPATSPEFEEVGKTFAENARGKALFYAARNDFLTLADDSGLEIDALDGEPGVRSARYIDSMLSQDQRNLEVLARLEGVPKARRTARFICHLVLARGSQIVSETRGECAGVISHTARGNNGFGYDPIFLSPVLGQTFAEITSVDKSRRSHRGRALRQMLGPLCKALEAPADARHAGAHCS